MKDNNIVNTDTTDVEKILKTKMNELSDSVDCFDRISAQVFAEDHFGFSDNEFTVSGLENVTGRSNVPKILKWTATAVAAVIGIAVIPQTNFVRRMFSKVTDGENKFPAIMEELETELESGTYIYIDVPLKYYIENDVLVTPLFCCPFEDCNKEDANVRLFTKQIDGIETTQMYAVLYDGIYTEKNIIAAAESKYKFTAEDLTSGIDTTVPYLNSAETAAEIYFDSNDRENIINSEGNIVSVASFSNTVLTKDEQGGLKKQSSEIIFGHKDDSQYFYDILIYNNGSENYSRDNMWKNSVYFNGNSSYPEISESHFTRMDIFGSLALADAEKTDLTYIYPFVYDEELPDIKEDIFTVTDYRYSSYLKTIPVPSDIEALLSLKIYLPVSVFSIDEDVEIRTYYNINSSKVVYYEDDILVSEEEQEEIFKARMAEQQELAELAHQKIKEEEEIAKQKYEEYQKEIEKIKEQQQAEGNQN